MRVREFNPLVKNELMGCKRKDERERDGNETTVVSYQEERPQSGADEVCTDTGN